MFEKKSAGTWSRHHHFPIRGGLNVSPRPNGAGVPPHSSQNFKRTIAPVDLIRAKRLSRFSVGGMGFHKFFNTLNGIKRWASRLLASVAPHRQDKAGIVKRQPTKGGRRHTGSLQKIFDFFFEFHRSGSVGFNRTSGLKITTFHGFAIILLFDSSNERPYIVVQGGL